MESNRTRNRRGAALVYVVVLAVLLAGMSVALLGMNVSTTKARVETQTAQRSFYAAEAGISDAYYQVNAGRITPDVAVPFDLGTEANPIALGPSFYWTRITKLNSRSYSIDSNGLDGRDRDRVELVMAEVPNGFFQYAAFGADRVILDANSFVDSYDSALGNYVDQVNGGNEFALEHGNVGSNGDIMMRSNTEIHGDALPGPGHVVDDSASNTYISGSTDPAPRPFPMPPIDVPVIPTSGTINTGANVTLGPGPVHYTGIRMAGGSTLRIVGPAKVVIDDLLMRSNTDLVFDSTNGPIEVYGTKNFVLESNSTIHTITNSAVGVTLLLSGDNTSPSAHDRVSISANSDFIGAIYAPKVNFRLASNFDVYGSIICKYLDLSSFGEIHFDEALLYDGWGATHEYKPALWHRMPHE